LFAKLPQPENEAAKTAKETHSAVDFISFARFKKSPLKK
jgi:hypothetical protein